VNYSGDGATLESDLESAIIELMNKPALLKQYGEAGRKRAASEFGWPAVARATLALYQSLIK
jgi:starch synthase